MSGISSSVAVRIMRYLFSTLMSILSNPNLYVISGGPGAGKTTVLAELEKLGFPFAREVARQIIREQMEAGGLALPVGGSRSLHGSHAAPLHRVLPAAHAC